MAKAAADRRAESHLDGRSQRDREGNLGAVSFHGQYAYAGRPLGGLRVEPILFEPGMAAVQSQSAQQLDVVSKLLKDKSRTELRLSGQVSEGDLAALKREIFWQRIDAAKGAHYQEALVRVYKDLRGVTQPAMPLSPIAEESLERFVLERIEINPKEIAALAQNRAELVRRELIERGVDPERLMTTAQTETVADAAPGVSVELVS
jgi:hypothetical protein